MGLCPCYAYNPQGVPLPVSRMLILIVDYPYCGIAGTHVALRHMKHPEITENFMGELGDSSICFISALRDIINHVPIGE